MRETNDAIHNPFKNRFHDPVTWRLDEMQAHANIVWLHRRDHENESELSNAVPSKSLNRSDPTTDEGKFAGLFGFVLVFVASVVVLLR